jgi:hypothetical protein
MAPSRSAPAFRTSALLLPLLFALAACQRDDAGVTIKGDVPDLDIAALRGDSLVAEATRPLVDSSVMADYTDPAAVAATLRADSISRLAAAASTPRRIPPVTSSGRLGDNPITRRAQARGDSMARASARAYAGTLSREPRAGGDSVRGTVTLLGNAPARQAVLKDANGTIITLSGMATSGLAGLEGAEVVARGVRVTPRDVVVSGYIVRAVDGAPAWDGKLEETADGWSLQLTDGSGRKRIAAPSAQLRALAGARVWISMRAGNTPTGFGVVGRR